jgi:hypothetical protein
MPGLATHISALATRCTTHGLARKGDVALGSHPKAAAATRAASAATTSPLPAANAAPLAPFAASPLPDTPSLPAATPHPAAAPQLIGHLPSGLARGCRRLS